MANSAASMRVAGLGNAKGCPVTAGHEWDDLGVAGVITASDPSWIAPFTGLSPRSFGALVGALRREEAGVSRLGRPWSLSLEDRVLLVTAYWRTNLTLRQLVLQPQLRGAVASAAVMAEAGAVLMAAAPA